MDNAITTFACTITTFAKAITTKKGVFFLIIPQRVKRSSKILHNNLCKFVKVCVVILYCG